MEDMARLALVEQSVRDIDKYNNILYQLLKLMNIILENPHDHSLKTIKSEILKEFMKLQEFSDYLKYVGFETNEEGNFVYPSKNSLNNLRMAQAAIERKINYCFGKIDKEKIVVKPTVSHPVVKSKLLPVNVLTTKNPFLLEIQELFNNILMYEDEELQALAREQIPIVTLQLKALDRVREQQMRIKKGETKEHDLPFDIALLMELMLWFKYKFFSWVDKPDCEACGGPTTSNGITYMTTETETCRVELYVCTACGGATRFVRHQAVRAVLRARRGRCGEWASCFALVCRALGYHARYVYDVTDHVWCEVYDFDSESWVHVDPCEAKMNTPLLYSRGWGKKLTYVIAVSKDDLQDVTWKYTQDHKEVLARRTQCSESELIQTILTLRAARQQHVTAARRAYLARRTVMELVDMMTERKDADESEICGRTTGSVAWRLQRGEMGSGPAANHTFEVTVPGEHVIRYHTTTDEYSVLLDGSQTETIKSWSGGAYSAHNVFWKFEDDWRQVYLARKDGGSPGTISWRVSSSDVWSRRLSLWAHTKTFEGAQVKWSVRFDGEQPVYADVTDKEIKFDRSFNTVEIQAEISGGVGDAAWQHSQLFRQHADDTTPTLVIGVHAVKPSVVVTDD